MVTGLKLKDGVVQGSSCGRETRSIEANRPQKQQKRTVDLQTGLGNHSHTLIPRPLGHRVTAEAASHKKNFNALIPIKKLANQLGQLCQALYPVRKRPSLRNLGVDCRRR
ncbi:hypothetical protein PCANC_05484 [Puccinia coronata f. sp. avenae]|uniref:Uncharacterized protein n=1 Tax=Puccinia coronata f. sp. avenae TaxID=200324 RepID=A0A2N5T6I0_9BASI|nr:hypothetical protein PCANC_05484 [Puccinia coronata f. sp. avenae]